MRHSNKFDLLSSNRKAIQMSTDWIDIFACANLYGDQIPIEVYQNKEGRKCVPIPLDWDIEVEFDDENQRQNNDLFQQNTQALVIKIMAIINDTKPNSKKKLTPRQRTAFLLRVQQHMSFAEIANSMNTSKSTAYKNYYLARKKIIKLCAHLLDT